MTARSHPRTPRGRRGCRRCWRVAVPRRVAHADERRSDGIDHVETGGEQIQVLFSVPGPRRRRHPRPRLRSQVDLRRRARSTRPPSCPSDRQSVKRTSVLDHRRQQEHGGRRTSRPPRPPPWPTSTPRPTTSTSAWSPSPATSTRSQTPTQDHDELLDGDRRARAEPADPPVRRRAAVARGRRRHGQPQHPAAVRRQGQHRTPTSTDVLDAAEEVRGPRSTPSASNQEITSRVAARTRSSSPPTATVTSTSDPDSAEGSLREPRPTTWPSSWSSPSTAPAPTIDEGTLAVSVDGRRHRRTPTRRSSRCADDRGRQRRTDVREPRRSSLRAGPPLADRRRALLFGGPRPAAALRHSARSRPAKASPMQRQLSLYTVHGMRRTETGAASVRRRRPQGRRRSRSPTSSSCERDLEDKIARKLDAGGLKLKPAEWLLLHAGILIGAGLVGLLLFGGNPIVHRARPGRAAPCSPGSTCPSRRRAGSRSSTASWPRRFRSSPVVCRPVCRSPRRSTRSSAKAPSRSPASSPARSSSSDSASRSRTRSRPSPSGWTASTSSGS